MGTMSTNSFHFVLLFIIFPVHIYWGLSSSSAYGETIQESEPIELTQDISADVMTDDKDDQNDSDGNKPALVNPSEERMMNPDDGKAKLQPDVRYGTNINPLNVRFPELLSRKVDGGGRRRPLKPGGKQKTHLLPNMYQPVMLPLDDADLRKLFVRNALGLLVRRPGPPVEEEIFERQFRHFGRKVADKKEREMRARTGYGRDHWDWRELDNPGSRDEGRYSQQNENGRKEEVSIGKHTTCGGRCAHDEFLCLGSCTCIPMAFRCDGDPDCPGRQDELECGEVETDNFQSCLEKDNNVRCPRSGKCIKKNWLCDGDDDCGDYSDESHCDGRNCTENEYECANGFCIRKDWVCDGDNDCKDFSDETDCIKKRYCGRNEFHCADGTCISLTWKCDQENDCPDSSDEIGCPLEPLDCREDEFECAYQRCVRKSFKCDGDNDCGDWSDEEDCPDTDQSCGPSEFRCNGGKCIPDLWKCDEEIDCENGEDETDCENKPPKTCGPDEFTCNNGNCILKTWVCDTVQDCSKGEDEAHCQHACHETQFNCIAHRGNNTEEVYIDQNIEERRLNCIARKHICDGKKDCPRGEDEKNCPREVKCEADSPCDQLCLIYPNGESACACRLGFDLSEDNHTCEDIDECSFDFDPICSQLCRNTIGSFACECKKGYLLRPDGRTCKAIGDPPTLIFANRVDIRQVSLSSFKYTAILKGLENAIALDYHHKKDLIFWSDVSMDVIKRAKFSEPEKMDVVKTGLESPGGVAVDWIHDLLFWTDSGTHRVEVATLDGRLRCVIVSHDLDKPRAIVAHPGKAVILWTDWGPKPKIEIADMDGENRKSIITEGVFWPNGLAIDYVVDRLYWTDAKHHSIECSNLDGKERRKVVAKGLPHPFAITVFEESIYWTDWHTKAIASADKDTGMGYRIIHSGLHFPMDIHSYHAQRQPPYENKCGANGGGCSHLCLPTRDSFRCACPVGLFIDKDGKTCTDTPEIIFIYTRSKDIRIAEVNRKANNTVLDMVIPLNNIRSAAALTFDADHNTIYWADVESHKISKSFLNSSGQEEVISNVVTPFGMAMDWVTRKLYWTDSGFNRIEVSNMNGSLRGLLIWENLDEPRDIAVDPIGGYMYWTQWGENPRIERAGMNGLQRETLINKDLKEPSGVAIDYEKNRLYWVDAETKAIEYSNLDGTGRTTLKIKGVDVQRPYGLDVYGDTIYWTDSKVNSFQAADKDTGENGRALRSRLSSLTDVIVFHKKQQKVRSPCLVDNGGCSHFCFLAPPPQKFSCGCPTGITMMADGKTCVSSPTNSLMFAHRTDIHQISLDVPYLADFVLPLPPMKGTISLDVDRKTGEIYWTDTELDMITKAYPNGSNVENVIIHGLETADGLVVDSTGRKMYWTDAGKKSIEVSELDGSIRRVLIYSQLENPRAIALHYHHGYMFWSDWGKNPKIERADMNGKNRMLLISGHLVWPNGLAVDRPAGRLYWNDGKLHRIESCNFEGKDRKVLLEPIPHPYGLVIVGSHIYWTDWKTESVHRADKANGGDLQIIRSGLPGIMDIRSIQAENIAENACGNDNGGCSHLCLRKPGGYSCDCPTGLTIRDNSKDCNMMPLLSLMLAMNKKLIRISLDYPNLWDVNLDFDVGEPAAIDYHYKKHTVFYTGTNMTSLWALNMANFSDNRLIASGTKLGAFAVDWLANNLYFGDTAKKVLVVTRLDGSSRKIVVPNVNNVRSVALFPERGYIFWIDIEKNPKIERCLLDGSDRQQIVQRELGSPHSLTIDYYNKKLYWADNYKHSIDVSDFLGRNRMQLVRTSVDPLGLTLYGQLLYWTDGTKKAIYRVDKGTGIEIYPIKYNVEGATEIKIVSNEMQVGWSPCQEKNGHCSHLCLFRRTDYICACPDLPDDRPCVKEPKVRVPIKKIFEEGDEMWIHDEDKTNHSPVERDPDFEKDLQKILRNHNYLVPDMPMDTQSFEEMFVLLFVVTLLITLLLMFSFYVLRLRRRTKEKLRQFSNVLAFSNPNYSIPSTEGGAPLDRKQFSWKKLRYDRSQDRVYGVSEDLEDDKPNF